MKRYQFWFLFWLPWLALIVTVIVRKDAPFPWIFVINTVILNLIAINIRRKQVGLNRTSALKAMVPGVGYHEWKRLYFAKP
ncbi:hypothetical protein H8S95_15070 [Pontibacter sp. KCTC 32443]|uniref:hypothetical protein n=1 Tax=Pontibacter TaxID=323449 RepID=UPI00164CE979|nr:MULTISPECIES: hypothetical protein [Pontibacter]MBC5775399.1 hypothetical protein [Pontibacter sp. KCTC 32443]